MKIKTVTDGATAERLASGRIVGGISDEIQAILDSVNAGTADSAAIAAWDAGETVSSFESDWHLPNSHSLDWVETEFTVTATGTYDCCFNCRMTDEIGGDTTTSGSSSKIQYNLGSEHVAANYDWRTSQHCICYGVNSGGTNGLACSGNSLLTVNDPNVCGIRNGSPICENDSIGAYHVDYVFPQLFTTDLAQMFESYECCATPLHQNLAPDGSENCYLSLMDDTEASSSVVVMTYTSTGFDFEVTGKRLDPVSSQSKYRIRCDSWRDDKPNAWSSDRINLRGITFRFCWYHHSIDAVIVPDIALNEVEAADINLGNLRD